VTLVLCEEVGLVRLGIVVASCCYDPLPIEGSIPAILRNG